MKVSDLDVAAVRAFLEQDQERHRQLRAQLGSRDGYSALMFCAFFEALNRRFGRTSTDADIIDFIGNVRSRSDKAEADIDPTIAERVIKNVLHSEIVDDVTDATVVQYQVMLLAILVADEDFDDQQLDQFLVKARTFADHMLSV